MSIETAKQLIQKGNLKSAINLLSAMHFKQNDDVQICYLLACLFIDTNQPSKAQIWLEKTLDIDSDFIEAHSLKANMCLLNQEYEQALESFLLVYHQRPEDHMIANGIGKCYEKLDNKGQAIYYYQKVFKHSLCDAEFALAYAGYLEKCELYTKALEVYQEANERFVNHADLLYQHGYLLDRMLRTEEALSMYANAFEVSPDNAVLLSAYATTLHQTGQLQEARVIYEKMMQIEAFYLDGLISYANLEYDTGEINHAAELLKRAVSIEPNSFAANFNYANVLQSLQLLEDAEKHYKITMKIDPNYAGSFNNCGNLYSAKGMSSEAIQCFEKVLELSPNDVMGIGNLGALYLGVGLNEQAIELSTKAIEIEPSNVDHVNNLLYALNYPKMSSEKYIFQKHRDCVERLLQQHEVDYSHAPISSNLNHKENRRIRVGYVSGDFCIHSVAFFFEPLLREHNREQFEVFCYNNRLREDVKTLDLKQFSEHWRNIIGLSDQAAYDLIRQDGIDILVDLSGHTNGNRLLLFALQPAQIQINWLGYPNTTGLKQMHYRFTDDIADPEGEADELYSEKLIRLANGAWCYQGDESLRVTDFIPSQKNGFTTYGSFNNIAKMNDQVIDTWSALLKKDSTAKLLIKSRQFADKVVKQRFIDRFVVYGVAAQRLMLIDHMGSYVEHMQCYEQIDVALDPFPYNGTTTTFEAFWMGVPVVTLAQECHRSRVSASIASRLNHADFICSSTEEYIDKCLSLSKNQSYLRQIRTTLRDCMKSSLLCDGKQFAQQVELEYKKLMRC